MVKVRFDGVIDGLVKTHVLEFDRNRHGVFAVHIAQA